MADASHLERMGRELKCPICLSLLNSAVSLSCNHVFCGSCIEKSMKTASDCPVCKVPFRRREIRPAPHMDNLVNVYKSMETAFGVSIFVTQNADSTKISDEDNQSGDNIGAAKDAMQTGKNLRQGKGSKGSAMTNKRPSGSNTVKPSCPTKKRVQVPQYPTAETQMEPERLADGVADIDKKKTASSLVSQKGMSSEFERGETFFSPFFWLREEDDMDKTSQQTDDNQVMHTPPDAPCFSDIKDSDDEHTCKRSPERGTCIISKSADFFDSEMFDWTQRPCSPELCSTPKAMQVEETDHNGAQKKAETNTGPKISPNNREGLGKKRTDKCFNTRGGRKTSETRKRKRAKKPMSEGTVSPTELGKVAHEDTKEGSKDISLTLKGKPKRKKKVCSEAILQDKSVPSLFHETEPLPNSSRTTCSHVSASDALKKGSGGSRNSKRIVKSSKSPEKTLVQPKEVGGKVYNGNFETGKVHINTEQHNKTTISASHTKFSPLSNDNKVSDRRISRTYEENREKLPSSSRKVKYSVKDNYGGICLTANTEDAIKGQTLEEIQGATDQKGIQVLAEKDKAISSLGGRVLVKCNTSISNVRCAFCQSSEESEESGIMVCYVNGKPVADNHNARTNAVHVHKNCTEWAPNVYFEGDSVISLESELSRSRRITCSCCGIKGAALGCYEKSCRKSFHVPCARLTPQCRWDYDNFVILCPIHASCPLPNEIPVSQSRQKKKSATERKARVHHVKTPDECKTDSTLPWKPQKKFKNLVLCCSALTTPEKEIVTKFEKISGVTTLKNWDSNVTHIIASTDENGACRRTLKFLMGVLEGKWILSVQWIRACMEAGELVAEQLYEISVDIHGIRDGPRLGRLRLLNKQSKLFEGYVFFFMGDFEPSYKGYLHNLVIAGGGKVLNRKPVAGDQAIASSGCPSTTFIIYSLELPGHCRPSANGNSILNQRRAQAEALASSTGAVVASNSWILNSISGYGLQKIGE